MPHTLSWKWLCSRIGWKRAGTPGRTRPCLAALEQLEDRVLLSTAAAPIPLSAQGLAAVTAAIKTENNGIAGQNAFIQAENGLIQQAQKANSPLPSAIVDYFLKIDGDFLKIDTDLIGAQASGTTGTTAAPGSIDAILIGFKLPLDTDIKLEAQTIPAVGQALQATNAVMSTLQSPSPATTVIHPAAVVDYFLKLDGIEGEAMDAKHKDSIEILSFSWGVIENELINADPTALGPALGPQGSATPGPAGVLDQDLATLAADLTAVPTNSSGGLLGSSSAVDTFLKWETSFYKDEATFLKFEQAALTHSKIDLTSGDLAYFIKLDTELSQISNDLFVPGNSAAGTAATGIDVVLGQLKLPAATLKNIQTLESELAAQGAAAQQAISDVSKYRDIIGDLDGNGTPRTQIVKDWEAASTTIAALENVLGSLDSTGQLGNTGKAGLLAGLVQDAQVLSADATGTFPGVDAFLTLEGQINNTQNAFLQVEQGFLKLGAQLPSAIVDYFLKIDDAFLEIDAGLIDTTTTGSTGTTTTNPGIDTILTSLTRDFYAPKIKNLAGTVATNQQSLMADESSLLNSSGTTPTAAAVDYFLKLDGIQATLQQTFAAINSSLLDAENQLLSVVPPTDTNYQAFIQDSKNIADGAAKGQAQE